MQKMHPQLVITGLMFPDTTGTELLRALRAIDPRLPVIVLTMRSEEEVMRQPKGTGSVLRRQHPVASDLELPPEVGARKRALVRDQDGRSPAGELQRPAARDVEHGKLFRPERPHGGSNLPPRKERRKAL
jgi:CheY-like chemotaxis protein